MQTLKLAPHVFDELDKGKFCTIREGYKPVFLGALRLESTDGRDTTVQVRKVTHTHIDYVEHWYLNNEGCGNTQDLIEKLSEFYPNINHLSEITIVEFIQPTP